SSFLAASSKRKSSALAVSAAMAATQSGIVLLLMFLPPLFAMDRSLAVAARLDVRKQFQLAVTVTQMLHPDTHLVHEGQRQTRHREPGGHLEMPAALNESATPAHDRNGQIPWHVRVAVAHARAINDERIVQERAVSVGSRLHLFDEMGEQFHMVRVDF